MTNARLRFSLFQVFEFITLVAITIAADRLLRPGLFVPGLSALGELTGAYLAIRWTAYRPRIWNDIWRAIGISASVTLFNATVFGIVVVEQFRAMYPDYFNWGRDWTEFAGAIGLVTVGGTVVGALAFTAARLIMELPKQFTR
jgi:hypothetical protein